MNSAYYIALNTFKEAVLQKIFALCVIFCMILALLSVWLKKIDLGSAALQFVADFSCSAIEIFGIILAIVATSKFFFSEIENKTILTLLSKPVHRYSFTLGKFMGSCLFLGLYQIIVISGLTLTLIWQNAWSIEQINLYGIFIYGILQWLKLCIASSITILICTFSTSFLYSVFVSFFAYGICQIQHIAKISANTQFSEFVAFFLSRAFPDFYAFNNAQNLIFGSFENFAASIFLYAIVYIIFFQIIAAIIFQKKRL